MTLTSKEIIEIIQIERCLLQDLENQLKNTYLPELTPQFEIFLKQMLLITFINKE